MAAHMTALHPFCSLIRGWGLGLIGFWRGLARRFGSAWRRSGDSVGCLGSIAVP